MKLEKLPFDVREEGDDSKLPVFVMLRLTGIDDEDPSLLEGDMLPLKPLRFARDPEARDPCQHKERLPLRVRSLL
jgi:hypothetical protein